MVRWERHDRNENERLTGTIPREVAPEEILTVIYAPIG